MWQGVVKAGFLCALSANVGASLLLCVVCSIVMFIPDLAFGQAFHRELVVLSQRPTGVKAILVLVTLAMMGFAAANVAVDIHAVLPWIALALVMCSWLPVAVIRGSKWPQLVGEYRHGRLLHPLTRMDHVPLLDENARQVMILVSIRRWVWLETTTKVAAMIVVVVDVVLWMDGNGSAWVLS